MSSFSGISRTAVSLSLALVCAVFITIAVVRTWASDAIYDNDRFAGTTIEVLEREDVRDEISRRIVDQVIKQQPDLVSARPIIETVVETAIRSKAFESIIAGAARDLHRTVFETDQRSLILNLSDLMTIAAAGVRAYDPALAERLPGGPDTAAIEVASRNTATQFAEYDRRLAALSWALVALGAASFAGSVLVGGSIQRSAGWLGLFLVASAIVVWLAVGIIATVIERQVGGDEVVGRAAAAAWRIYADGLVWWMWVQALIGVVLAVMASNLVAPRPIAERVEAFRGRWQAAWAQNAVRIVLAGGLSTLGVLLMVAPGPTLQVAAQAAGLGLLYLGGGELVRGLGFRPERNPGVPRRIPRFSTALFAPRLLAGGGLMVAVAFAVVVFWTNRDSLRASPAGELPPIEHCNGMAELCDRPLDEVVFAATHNSMSAAEEPGWFFAEQMRPIRRQLDDGVRALLIDVYYGYATNRGVRTDPAVGNVASRLEPWFGEAELEAARNLADAYGPIPRGAQPALYLCHGYCELGATSFDRVMAEVAGFLSDHPHEVVIFFLQDYVDPFDVQDAFERTRLIDYVFTIEPGAALPTLREMIEVDRRLLVFSENVADKEAPPWYHPAFELTQDTPYGFRSVGAFVCDPFRGDQTSPLFLLNHWISRSPPSPAHAESPNSFDVMYGRARQCQEERGKLPNVIAVNFYETGDLFAVVEALNDDPFATAEPTKEDAADD